MRFNFLFLLFISFFGNAQNKITDSTIILGITKNSFTNVSTQINNSGFKSGEDFEIPSKSTVLIFGAKRYNTGSQNFDYYKIIYKGKIYFIYKEDIIVTKMADEAELVFEDLLSISNEQSSNLEKFVIGLSGLLDIENRKKALKFIESCKPYGIVLLNNSIYDESEYTDGTSFEFQIQNLSTKTIKYITFNLIGFNSVDDKIIDRGSSIKSVKGVGPISKNEAAKFSFKYVWFTDLVETFLIKSIKIQYMDGSFKNIEDPKRITLSKENRDILFNED